MQKTGEVILMKMKFHHYFHPKHLAKKKSKTIDRFAYVFVILGILFVVPQAFKIYSEQQAGGLEIVTWIAFSFMGVFWLYYAIERDLKPLIISAVFKLIINIIIVVGIVKYG